MNETRQKCVGEVSYRQEPMLSVSEFRRILADSGLGSARPVDDDLRLAAILAESDLLLTARAPDGMLQGVLRCLTDFHWSCFVPDLAVCGTAQGLGIGRGLLTQLRNRLGPRVAIHLVSVPGAVNFYERIGLSRTLDAFVLPRLQ
jgi:GNAT superfamily N-acetyltransferase